MFNRGRFPVDMILVCARWYWKRVLRDWGQALKRRSQLRRYAWVHRLKLATKWLPQPHPWPSGNLTNLES
jgi:hypothetical protein